MRTVPVVPEDGAHGETLPAPSTVRNWTSVSPVPLTDTPLPEAGADQVEPPSVDVWNW